MLPRQGCRMIHGRKGRRRPYVTEDANRPATTTTRMCCGTRGMLWAMIPHPSGLVSSRMCAAERHPDIQRRADSVALTLRAYGYSAAFFSAIFLGDISDGDLRRGCLFNVSRKVTLAETQIRMRVCSLALAALRLSLNSEFASVSVQL